MTTLLSGTLRSAALASFAALVLCASASAQIGVIPGWRMVWNEEFSGPILDPATWTAENLAWPYNSELEFYLPGQATVQGGILNIKAERRNYGGRNYVSARIDTSGKFSQQYGRFEARMKLPFGQGYWPAFWLLPASEAWPPEIDIMEQIGSQPNTILMTQHWGTVSNVMSWGGTYTGPNYTADYHQFAVEWSPQRIDWFIDGVQRFSTTSNVPQEPMYIILNLAIGGILPGNPTPSTVFPGSMLVDWVRVYQRDLPLLNPGFENPTAGGSPTSWQIFGNTQQSTLSPRTGTKSLRIGGISGTGPYYAGAFQDLPASPGQVWRAATNARNPSATRLLAGNQVVLKIEWYDAAGTQISFVEVPAITDASPVDTYIPVSLDATAPANTAKARIALVFVQTGTGSGSALFDDMAFGFISPVTAAICFADFDSSGAVSIDDLFLFFNAWFIGTPNADVDGSGGVSIDDLFVFLNQWFQGCP